MSETIPRLCSPRTAVLLSAAVALLGMLYELVLAYGLSAVLGGTYRQYAFTVGLFTLTLGAGAFLYERKPTWFVSAYRFALLQGLIAACGLFSAWWIFSVGFVLAPETSGGALQLLLLAPMALIGVLTGVELPWLMRGQPSPSQSVILGFDFVGMFAAALLFPLILLPGLGATGVFMAAIGGNIALACLMLFRARNS